MRMWLIPAQLMCRRHLLGEHVEIHMLLGCLRKGKRIEGFLKERLVDPRSMYARHEELVAEMLCRGYRHKSPLDEGECLKYQHITSDVCLSDNMRDLSDRCLDCRKRMGDDTSRTKGPQ